MSIIPSVHYTKNGDFTLAYQVTGSGPKDLIYLPADAGNVVGNWFAPEHARFMEQLASFSRLVITDRRGLGCSDRLPPGVAPTLEELVDDLLVVMEQSMASPATILAGDESAFTAMMAAATHPDRFEGLILWGASPSWRWSEDLPWESKDDAIEATLGQIRRVTDLRAWAEVTTRDYFPSWHGDPEKVALVEAFSALSGSAEAWYQDQRMFYDLDLRDLIGSIQTPTLLLGRDSPRLNVESSRYLLEHLSDARLIWLEGRDAYPWIGDADAVVAEIQEFLTGTRRPAESSRALATVLFTDIVGSTERAAELGDRAFSDLLDRHHERIRAELAQFGGTEVDTAGDGFLATFDGPARGVRCAAAMVEAVRELGIEIRAGLHTGEIERTGTQVRGIAVHIGARIAAAADPSEILVSSTVRDLTGGSDIAFEDAGEHDLKGVPDRWRLYRVVT